MGNKAEEEQEIDLGKLIKALWHKAWVIVLAMLICGGTAFVYAAYAVTPLYEANALLYVNNGSLSVGGTSISLSDLSASKTLVDTYTIILKTRLTLNEVIEETGLDYTYEELLRMVSAEAVNDTEIFRVTVTSPVPQEAELITNTIVEVLPDKVAEVIDGCSVRTVDFAVTPVRPISPNITKYTMCGILIGMLISCVVIVLLELLDNQIPDEDYLIQNYHLPVLAKVPNIFDNGSVKKYGGYGYGYGTLSERKGKSLEEDKERNRQSEGRKE